MSPLQAIKKYCLWCTNGQKSEIKQCPVLDCPLYERRFGKGYREGSLRAIRDKCLDCTSWHDGMVLSCEKTECALHDFRLGKNPNRKGIRSGYGSGDKRKQRTVDNEQ